MSARVEVKALPSGAPLRRFLLVNARCLQLGTVDLSSDRYTASFAVDSVTYRRPVRPEYTLSLKGGEILQVEAVDANDAVSRASRRGLWLVFDATTGECCTGDDDA